MRLPRLSVALAAAVALGGCYGSTGPASEVTAESARLHGQGTADRGPAYSQFEYWASGSPDRKLRTPRRNWPGGASGPLSERVGFPLDLPTAPVPLSASTPYSFRVCGNDEGRLPVCAQSRDFTTRAPEQDAVKGLWSFPPAGMATRRGDVDAKGGIGGPSPNGVLSHENYPARSSFSGRVTCIVVSGSRATVGARGGLYDLDTDSTEPASTLVTVEDGGADLDADRVGVRVLPPDPPPDCSAPVSPLETTFLPSATVYDAP